MPRLHKLQINFLIPRSTEQRRTRKTSKQRDDSLCETIQRESFRRKATNTAMNTIKNAFTPPMLATIVDRDCLGGILSAVLAVLVTGGEGCESVDTEGRRETGEEGTATTGAEDRGDETVGFGGTGGDEEATEEFGNELGGRIELTTLLLLLEVRAAKHSALAKSVEEEGDEAIGENDIFDTFFSETGDSPSIETSSMVKVGNGSIARVARGEG